MAAVTIVLSGDDVRLRAAHERWLRDQEKALENYQKAINKSKEVIAQSDKDAAAKRVAAEEQKKHNDTMAKGEVVFRSTRTAAERYNERISELNRLLKAGAIDFDTFGRASKQAADDLKDSDNSFLAYSKNLVVGGGIVATAYASMSSAMAIYNKLLDEQKQLQNASLEKTKALAAAQSDAVKNLAGLNMMQSSELMNKEVERIASATGFENRALIAQSIGAGISAGGSVEEVLSSVEANARLNKLTPDQLGASSSGTIDVGRATGLKDAESNIGFIADIAAVSRVEKLDKLVNNLGKSLGSITATVKGVDRETAAREGGALFAFLNTAGNDIQGDSTATASVQFASYLRTFFKAQEEEGVIADPGSLSGRIEALQGDAGLRANFLEKMPGEAAFKLPMEMLVTQGSEAFASFKKNFEAIDFDPETFRKLASQIQSLTPQLTIADAAASAQANITGAELNPENAAIAEIRNIREKTLPKVRPSNWFSAMRQVAEEMLISRSMAEGSYDSSVTSSAKFTRDMLTGSRRALEGDNSPRAIEARQLIDKQLEIIKSLENAARQNLEAANKNLEAANKREKGIILPQPSVAGVARLQAGTAGQ